MIKSPYGYNSNDSIRPFSFSKVLGYNITAFTDLLTKVKRSPADCWTSFSGMLQ